MEERDQAIADQLAKSCHGMGLSHCEDCGEAISEQRQKAVPGLSALRGLPIIVGTIREITSMSIQLDLWQLLTFLIGLLLAFMSFCFVAVRLLLAQVDNQLSQRFKTMEQSQETANKNWESRFNQLMDQNQRETDGWQSLERDFLRFQADLPINYVRREDYVRNQTVIEAKLDSVALKIENVQLKGLQQ
ncbi:TraR/DksA C4-type zinc finger protein [Paludibacterium denitrificans]|uniref:TraR/DksA C4-type zinc finger protein n=1 Tax=Paludibacterium denitrificans TaxID=2675226 RepID=UPI0028AC1CB9|nr:TraR/DksA C4-type zinc finger protein [Paludibacterium denitrificans]